MSAPRYRSMGPIYPKMLREWFGYAYPCGSTEPVRNACEFYGLRR